MTKSEAFGTLWAIGLVGLTSFIVGSEVKSAMIKDDLEIAMMRNETRKKTAENLKEWHKSCAYRCVNNPDLSKYYTNEYVKDSISASKYDYAKREIQNIIDNI